MKIRFLLLGTSLSLIPTLTFAQCVATQDCATLGYTETSCSGGSGVKCPFGNKWACFKSESEICNDLGFTLTCTGSNQTGGASKVCNGKYNVCFCTSGYTWNASSQKCEYDYKTNCTIGALYYSDGTCSRDKLSSKTLLGVVVYEKTSSANGWIMAVKPVKTGSPWSSKSGDIPELNNYTSTPTDIQSSCINTDIITAYGNNLMDSAWAAKNYKPTGTPSGKSWCLPSGGLLNYISDSTNFAKVNAGITLAGGTPLGDVDYLLGERAWSSSEYAPDSAWYLNNKMLYSSKTMVNSSFSVRAVMPF